jgi:hypothetical protein
MTVARIMEVLASRSFRFVTEDDLQRGLAEAFTADGIPFEREVPLTKRDRIDFVTGQIGVEVKIGGALSALTEQLLRYSKSDRVKELVLVTSHLRLGNLPLEIGGKRLTIVTLSRGFA